MKYKIESNLTFEYCVILLTEILIHTTHTATYTYGYIHTRNMVNADTPQSRHTEVPDTVMWDSESEEEDFSAIIYLPHDWTGPIPEGYTNIVVRPPPENPPLEIGHYRHIINHVQNHGTCTFQLNDFFRNPPDYRYHMDIPEQPEHLILLKVHSCDTNSWNVDIGFKTHEGLITWKEMNFTLQIQDITWEANGHPARNMGFYYDGHQYLFMNIWEHEDGRAMWYSP